MVSLFLSFPSLPSLLPILCWLFQVHQAQLVSQCPSCSIVFSFLARSTNLSLFFAFFYFHSVGNRDGRSTIWQAFFFYWLLFGFVVYPRVGDPFLYQYPYEFCPSYFLGFGLCVYRLFVWSNINFLYNSQLITFPIQTCLFLHSFLLYLLYSLIMWFIILLLHLQFILYSLRVFLISVSW